MANGLPSRRNVWIAGLIAVAFAAAAVYCAVQLVLVVSGRGVQPSAGTVAVVDIPGSRDHVSFVVSASADEAKTEREADARLQAAGLSRGSTRWKSLPDGLKELRVETTLPSASGFLSWHLDAGVLEPLHGAPLVLQVPVGTDVSGRQAQPMSSDILFSRYELQAPADVSYSYPAWRLALPVAVLIALGVLPYLALRLYGQQLVARELDDAEKLHRLQRVGLATMVGIGLFAIPIVLVSGLIILPGLLLSGLGSNALASGASTAATVATTALAALLPIIAAGLALAPTYRRLRGIPNNRAESRRKLRRGLLFLVPLVLWPLLAGALPVSGFAHLAVVLVGAFLIFAVVMPPLLVRALDTTMLEAEVREHLLSLCGEQGLRLRDARAIRARWQKTANAAFVGALPPLRYLLVTDHLVDEFPQDEFDAIVAHEICHGKEHHLLLQFLAGLGAFAGVIAGLAAAQAGLGLADGYVILALPFVFFAATIIVRGWLGVKLEYRADRYAARHAGAETMIAALTRLAQVNQTKRNTGRIWGLMTLHPSIDRRITALEGGESQIHAATRDRRLSAQPRANVPSSRRG
jgi:Zn-dependent protease with chaperone function